MEAVIVSMIHRNFRVDCRGRGLRAWHHAEPERQVCHERSRSPFATGLKIGFVNSEFFGSRKHL